MLDNINGNAPCKECANRYVGCHDSCTNYKIWKHDLYELKGRLYASINPKGCSYFKNYDRIPKCATKSKKKYK